jgi:hypothetical protein
MNAGMRPSDGSSASLQTPLSVTRVLTLAVDDAIMRSEQKRAMRVAHPSGHHGMLTRTSAGAVPAPLSLSVAERPIGAAASTTLPAATGGAPAGASTTSAESLGVK